MEAKQENTFNYDLLAKYYDKIYRDKNYDKEVSFLDKLLRKFDVKTILDVGCGTGNHIYRLEKYNYKCVGIDISQKMIEIAKKKVKAKLFVGDMRNFKLKNRFDAIISMFATFNYNLSLNDAEKTLRCFKIHLNKGGIVVLDLHNPQRNKGKKIIKNKDIEVIMRWKFDRKTKIEKTNALFKIRNKIIKDTHIFRIYSIKEIKELLNKVGFSRIYAYENYTFKRASSKSKNIIVVGIK